VIRFFVACVLCVSGCERAGSPQLVHHPKVGERFADTFEYTASIDGPDHKHHTLHSEGESTTEVLSVTGTYADRVRITILRDSHEGEGRGLPSMLGTFERAEHDGTVDVIRIDGAITPEQRERIIGAFHGTTATAAARDQFLERLFKVGDVIQLTPDEMVGLSFNTAKTMELTVEDVTATEVRFATKLVGGLPNVGTIRMHGPLRLFAGGGSELSQEGEILRGSEPIGTLQVARRSRPL
jgi:hypothetical protein